MDTLLVQHARTRCIADATFDKLFMHVDRHCMHHVFKLFDMCGGNEFQPPWSGAWITAQQARRLIDKLYGSHPSEVTPVTMSILQFVFDWWNIRHVFGTEHAFTELCGYPCLTPRQIPPVVGPRKRLTANEFAMVWCK